MHSVKQYFDYQHLVKSRSVGLYLLISVLSACGGGQSETTPGNSTAGNNSLISQNPDGSAAQVLIPGESEVVDTDNDGIADADDAFPLDNRESVDTDADGTGDNADNDNDNDGVIDGSDAFPLNALESADTDADGIGNNADSDDDNDGALDIVDAFPLDINESIDTDADGIGNNADNDDDNDGVLDIDDAFPSNSDESIDTDGDKQGDNSDSDIDNDGVANAIDHFPYDAERHSLQDAMQGNWTAGCIHDPETDGNLSFTLDVKYSGAEAFVAIGVYGDTSCSDYLNDTFSASSIVYVMSAEYGSEVITTDGRSAQRVDLETLDVISDFPALPESSQIFVSIEGDVMHEGTVDENNPDVYTLSDESTYTRTDSFIASELISAANSPTVVNPSVNPIITPRESGPTTSLLTENRTPPASGVYSSDSTTPKSNGADLFSDSGPQRVNSERVVSWPGLRYGNFLVSNNPWNASNALYPGWYQEISLVEYDNSYAAAFNWDWGGALDTNIPFNTKSFPEVIYGTKSAQERSGTFAETGLPVEIHGLPEITIDYQYDYEIRQSESPSATDTDSEFNVVIDSFFHSSCDIRRSGGYDDNAVFEMMVWLKAGDRKPSGDAPQDVIVTSDGRSFDVYTKVRSNPAYIAFVAQNDIQTGTIQYSELLRHTQFFAVEYGIYPLKDSDCLANISMGTEIWHGAATFSLKEFQVNRTY